jgi:phospholipase/carboxylesterase
MKAEIKQSKELSYIMICPDGYDPDISLPFVLVLHGFGANMQDLAGLCPMINDRDYIYFCPNAPLEFDLGMGSKGYGWHPPREMSQANDILQAESLLNNFIDELFDTYPLDATLNFMLGFSQGGGMTYRCGLDKPDKFKGLIALSASMPNPENLQDKMPQVKYQELFIAHGFQDQVVSINNAEETQLFLKNSEYSVEYNTYTMGHEIRPEVIADIKEWMVDRF